MLDEYQQTSRSSEELQGPPAHGVEGRHDPSLYLNRELSWLDFNDRVLQLAEDERVPLLERVKFCAIYTTNLDEYYMVRVAGLRDQIDAGVETPTQDGRTPSETIAPDPRAGAGTEPAPDRLLRRRPAPTRWPTRTSASSASPTSTTSAAPTLPGTSRRRSSPP